jgi:hypothetical protein
MPDQMCDVYPEVMVERALKFSEGGAIRSSFDQHMLR